MRQFCTTLALALAVSLAVSVDAEAKKDKKKKGGDDVTTEQVAEESASAEPMALTIETTGIADVDNIFTAAVAPLETIAKTREALDNVGTNLTSVLGLAEGTPLSDALNDLVAKAEGKINVAVGEQGMPKLEPGDAVPENVQQAIDAVNNSVNEVATAAAGLAELPAQFQQVAAAAASINPKSLTSSGVKATEIPKTMKKITGNLKVVSSAPGQVEALVKSVDDFKNTLTSAFAGGGAEAPAEDAAPTE
jgi:hypothetical protein